MNSVVTYHQSELANSALRLPHAGVRPAFLTNRIREIASDIAMVVAVLAFVLSFVSLRMTLFASANVVERVAIPLAAGGAVVFVLALLGSLALRPDDALST
jgi:hypothetical protein